MAAYNVLHLILDDLSIEIAPFGKPWVRTPHMDALAARGTTFERAYCQMALCGPSRNSFLTGRTPEATRVLDLATKSFREQPGADGWTTLPGHFREHGWTVLGFGKVFGIKGADREASFSYFSEAYREVERGLHTNPNGYSACPDTAALGTWCALDGDEELFVDRFIAREAAAPTWNRAGSVASSSVFAASAPNIEGILPRSVEIICAWTCQQQHVPAA